MARVTDATVHESQHGTCIFSDFGGHCADCIFDSMWTFPAIGSISRTGSHTMNKKFYLVWYVDEDTREPVLYAIFDTIKKAAEFADSHIARPYLALLGVPMNSVIPRWNPQSGHWDA